MTCVHVLYYGTDYFFFCCVTTFIGNNSKSAFYITSQPSSKGLAAKQSSRNPNYSGDDD